MNINRYALRKEREIQKFINKLPPLNAAAAAFRLMEGVNAANWKKHIWFIDGDVTMLG